MGDSWHYGLCGCDCVKCLYGMFCCSCAWASARTKYDGSNCVFNCCCVPPCVIRNIIREGYGISGSCVMDICWTMWCPLCTYVQTAREVDHEDRASQNSGGKNSGENSWTNGLCGCKCGGGCLYAWCLPTCAAASVRTKYDSSNCLFNCCCVTTPLTYNIIREGYAIKGDCITDIIIGCCFPCCAIHRMQREVEERGDRNKSIDVK